MRIEPAVSVPRPLRKKQTWYQLRFLEHSERVKGKPYNDTSWAATLTAHPLELPPVT
jgi:hypothetical protein